jgi:hypothetical protein
LEVEVHKIYKNHKIGIKQTLLNKLYKFSFIQVNIQQVRQAMANAMDQETLEKLAAEISNWVTENVIEYLD